MHRLGVDAGHHERRHPRAGDLVLIGVLAVGLCRTGEAWRQGERIGQHAADRGVLLRRRHGGHAAGHGAARQPAVDAAHPAAHARRRRAQFRLGRLLGEQHAQVERDRVEAAGEHDPRPGRLGRHLVPGHHRRDPVRLASQVDVVGSRRGAGRHQRFAVKLIGAHRGDDHLGAAGHRRQRRRRVGVGDHQRQAGRRADQITHLAELLRAAPGHRPRQVAGGAIGLEQVRGHQAAGVAGGAIDDHFELAAGVAHDFSSQPSRGFGGQGALAATAVKAPFDGRRRAGHLGRLVGSRGSPRVVP